MWKKSFKTQKSNLIKSSDKRKLKEKLLSTFPGLSKESLDELISNKEDIYQLKINGSRTTIYTNKDNEPLFFDLDGRERYFPTGTLTLWLLVTRSSKIHLNLQCIHFGSCHPFCQSSKFTLRRSSS